MKFKFKIQDYQTQAVNNVIKVFQGQPLSTAQKYLIDSGSAIEGFNYTGFKNADIKLSDKDVLANINEIQVENNIRQDKTLNKELGFCSLDIEMETGTGKTYVYIKTIFELNKVYGWNKFIIVVPSIAVREGVKKSFEIMEDHFMETYHKKAHYFIYDSKNLNLIQNFSQNNGINVMIINIQAFNSSMSENKKSSRIIYTEQDNFQSRKPIDVIKENKPILILDEPQKIAGKSTQQALKNNFDALFSLNYSATHRVKHNTVYVLDPLDAYNQKLVKKIEVIGLEIENLGGQGAYLALKDIIKSPDKPPRAEIEYEIKLKSGNIKKQTKRLDVGDDIFHESNELNQYENYIITDIDSNKNKIYFQNGKYISVGQSINDKQKMTNVRLQIRQTIQSHFEKEQRLYSEGIKVLSLFFIDEVSKYRIYDENNQSQVGEYGRIFEEEYRKVLNNYLQLDENNPYQQYLRKYCIDEKKVHNGYFSIDKKTLHITNGKIKNNSSESEDVSAYDLIMKNKEGLLSFDEPTRFIFSHSTLSEGWDNPNIFQICTLRLSGDANKKRQEVGRGLRICVNQDGNRMDYATCEDDKLFESYNTLTVISSGSYAEFVGDLQKDIKDTLYDRPKKASDEYFKNKTIYINDEKVTINEHQAKLIYKYLAKNDYIDDDDNLTKTYYQAEKSNTLKELPKEFESISCGIYKLIQSIHNNDKELDNMFIDGSKHKAIENNLNDNFYKKEFVELWNYLNHKYIYKVNFSSDELIQKAVDAIDMNLSVKSIRYLIKKGKQRNEITKDDLENQTAFIVKNTKTEEEDINTYTPIQVKYDLVGKIVQGTTLTRKTVVAILKKIRPDKFMLFRKNPEDFITQVISLINEQKATMIVSDITYDVSSEEPYNISIFTAEKHTKNEYSFKAKKHIQDLVFIDGLENSIEGKFVREIDNQDEVAVYAKLPRGFKIPTPVGNYTPDWAVAFKEDSVKHIYFVAETKGSMSSLQLREIEKTKINCAKKLFEKLNSNTVKYATVDSFKTLMDIVSK